MTFKEEITADILVSDGMEYNNNMRRHLKNPRARPIILEVFLNYFENKGAKGNPLEWVDRGAHSYYVKKMLTALIEDYLSGKIKLQSEYFRVAPQNRIKPFLTPMQELEV